MTPVNGVSRQPRDFSLNNNGDLIELRCGDLVIDSVQYGEGFPGAEQASLSLDLDATMLNQMILALVSEYVRLFGRACIWDTRKQTTVCG